MSFDKHDMTRRATAIMIQANDIVFVVVLVFLLLFWCFCCCFGKFESSFHTSRATWIYTNHVAVWRELHCFHLKHFVNKEEEKLKKTG